MSVGGGDVVGAEAIDGDHEQEGRRGAILRERARVPPATQPSAAMAMATAIRSDRSVMTAP